MLPRALKRKHTRKRRATRVCVYTHIQKHKPLPVVNQAVRVHVNSAPLMDGSDLLGDRIGLL